MSYKLNFFAGKVYCDNCNGLMKNHIDDINDGKISNMDKKCLHCASLFVGTNWRRYNEERGVLDPYFPPECDCACND